MTRKNLAFLSVGLAYVIWSFLGVIFQTSSFTAFQNIFLFSFLTCLYIIFVPQLRRKTIPLSKITWNKNLLFFCITSGLSAAFWFEGLSILPIAQAILLYASTPFFAYALESILLHNSFEQKRILALSLGLLGIIIIVIQNLSSSHSIHILGALCVLLGAFLNALQGIYNKKIAHQYSLLSIVLFIMLAQTVVTLPLAFISIWHINLYSFLTTIFVSIFATLIGYFLFVNGFKSLKTSTIMVIGYLDPLLSSLWGFLFLAQKLSLAVFIGGLFILLAGYRIVRLEQKS